MEVVVRYNLRWEKLVDEMKIFRILGIGRVE
jgi:hypothetical protein